MELKKVGYCYASLNQLKKVLNNYFNSYQDNYFFNVETNKGINFQLKYINKKYMKNNTKDKNLIELAAHLIGEIIADHDINDKDILKVYRNLNKFIKSFENE